MQFDIGQSTIKQAVAPGANGIAVRVSKIQPWPKGPCMVLTVMGAPWAIDGDAWFSRDGKETQEAVLERTWPGEALRDGNGKILCVPFDKQTQELVVDEKSPGVMAKAYPVTDQEVKDAKNGVHAFIRTAVIPATLSIGVDTLQVVDADIVVEFL